MNFHDNSKSKNGKIGFSFVSTHCASSIKTVSKLREGVYISLVGKKPMLSGILKLIEKSKEFNDTIKMIHETFSIHSLPNLF